MAKIVIADRDSSVRGALKFVSEIAGHEVVGTATDGGEALGLWRQLRPDLVILDATMRRISGLATLERIMQEDPAAKVIMVGLGDGASQRAQADALGASGWIGTPFELKRVMAEFDRVLKESSPCESAGSDQNSSCPGEPEES
jgi:two-component system chemotaxis response regulator CheY